MGSCKRLVDYLVMVFLNKSLSCDRAVLLPILFGRRGEGEAGFIYFTRRLPVIQNLDFCLISRKILRSPTSIGQAAYLTSGAIR